MTDLSEALRGASAAGRDQYRPVFFRPADPNDRAGLEELLERERATVIDHLHGQLVELVRALNPTVKFAPADLDEAATAHLGATPSELYGTWVYYPWSSRLVHLLDEAEFALVRTDRNRNKITREEQAVLATKKVGVIGLSVGQSVSLAMTLERSFGEIRLADFDTLELSNLNRIRSGVHEMGLNKVVNTAREIAEIDPFLKVTCFMEGITEANLDRFFTEGGTLDLLVEECDSVAVKILARQKAKALRIPVVMDTSDRGLIDVERFDLEPERPILHGLVDHLDLSLAAKARTNEEKLPFVVPIIGLDTMSTRMKASMLEIENSVTTWPQLGSAVMMGGAIVGHLARHILLDQRMPSGRWWMDPDELFGAKEEAPPIAPERQEQAPGPVVPIAAMPTLDVEDMVSVSDKVPGGRQGHELTVAEAELLAHAGSQAPSGGNCQPWRFLHHRGRLFLFLDGQRARSALDPGLRYALLGMGACVENMMLEARKHGIGLEHVHAPLPGTPQLVAVFSKSPVMESTDGRNDTELAGQIGLRCTNRKYSETLVMEDAQARALESIVKERHPGTKVTLVRDRALIEHIALLCGKAERLRFLNPTCHNDMFVREMRWNDQEAERTRDGIDVATLELSITDLTGLRVAADPKAVSLLRHWRVGNAMEKLTAKPVRASSALAVFSAPDLSLANAYAAGRAIQRFWLKASSMGIAVQPVSAPIFMGIHGTWDRQGILSEEEHREAGAILQELAGIIGATGAAPFFMMRLGKADGPSARSLRLPLSEVFHSSSAIHA